MNGSESQVSRSGAASGLLVKITLLYLALLVGLSVWHGTSAYQPAIMALVFPATLFIGMGLFGGNVVTAAFAKGYRARHLAFALFIVAGWIFSSWMNIRHIERRRAWFMQEGVHVYEKSVQEIMQNKSLLADQPRLLEGIAHGPVFISGKTNADGTVTIRFAGGEGGVRHGYLFHSGTQLSLTQANPEDRIWHLTNSWYEY
jgi:hypothetical protein